MKPATVLLFGLAACVAGSATAQPAAPPPEAAAPSAPGPAGPAAPGVRLDTAMFIAMAMSSNMLEIESSRLALARAQEPSVRAYAARMIQDHGRAGAEMIALVGGLPPGGPQLVPRHQAMLAMLGGAPMMSFDRAYVQLQAMAHQEAILLFAAYARTGDDPELRRFARRTIPTLQAHLAALRPSLVSEAPAGMGMAEAPAAE